MPTFYKNASIKEVPTSRTKVYTATANYEVILAGAAIANIDGVTDTTVDLEMYDVSEDESIYIGYKLPVIAGGTLTLDPLKVFLESGDEVYVTAGTANTVSIILSTVEVSNE